MIIKVTTASNGCTPWVLVAGGFHRRGGMDKANLALAEYLADCGHTVHLVAHSADRDLLLRPAIHLHEVPRPATSYFLGEQLLDIRGRSVANRVRRQYPHAQVVVNGGNCLYPGVNWVHYVHHAWTDEPSGAPPAFRLKTHLFNAVSRIRESKAFTRAKVLITNSVLTSGHLVEHFGIDPKRLQVIYLGADHDCVPVTASERANARAALNVTADCPVVSFVGGLGWDHRKGFDILLNAWSRLASDPGWDCILFVAGDGAALPVWRDRIAGLGLASSVRLLGFCRNVTALLAATDLLVSPVRYEPYGLNVQEAVCRGVPALVSESAGIAERYPSELHDMLLASLEPVSLSEKLRQWRASNNAYAARFSQLGACLRSRSWKTVASDFVAAVEGAVP